MLFRSAHYGAKAATPPPAPAPIAPAAPATPASPTPTPTPPASTPTSTPTGQSAETPSTSAPTQNNNGPEKTKQSTSQASPTPPPVQTATSSRVSVLSMMATRHAPVAALASLVMVCIAIIGYALTHRSAFQHAVAAGEHFVVAHPGIDSGIIAAITSLILLTTYGNLS